MKVKEIFNSIQGEGSVTGVPATFIRFSGCNLSCVFCDTSFEGGTEMTAKQILSEIPIGTKLVILTGGEPLMQPHGELIELLSEIDDNLGSKVQLETNGTIGFNFSDLIWKVTCSPKVPIEEMKLDAWDIDELKILYPCVNPEQYIELVEDNCTIELRLQPIWDSNYQNNLKKTIDKVMELRWALSIQTHKYLNVK